MSHEPVNIYVRLSDDGKHIRKWSFEPHSGAAAYVQTGYPATRPSVADLRIRALEQGLHRCRDQFSYYEQQHLAKHTEDGNAKAETNRGLVAMCDAVLEDSKGIGPEAIIIAAAKPWENFHGELPDYDHPLRCVFESGVQYAVELLAKQLDVESYDVCDGTEEFDGDLGGTLMNIVLEAMPKDEHGDPIWPRDLPGAIAPDGSAAK